MKTLLEYSYTQCKELRYENIQKQGLDRDIYDKVVDLAREKIRKALRNQMSKLVLRTIYLLKTKGVNETVEEIIGTFRNYKGSAWRLSMIHAVTSYICSKNHHERMLDIFDTCNMYFPCQGAEEYKAKVGEKTIILRESEDPDIFKYIDVYRAMDYYLLP